MSEIIAIHEKEYNLWGCPYCGYLDEPKYSGYGNQTDGSSVCACGECEKTFVLLQGKTKRTTFEIGPEHEVPELQNHPRAGIPFHLRADSSPEVGEYFDSRSVRMEPGIDCFCCGGNKTLQHNISGYVKCKASGERVVDMFAQGAYLDFRPYDPNYVQVKIGACENHLDNLKHLDEVITKCNGMITEDMVTAAMRG